MRSVVAALAALLAWAAVALPPATARRGGPAVALAGVSGTRFRAHVEFLADDLLEGREAGTRGYDLAARYVATELQALGLEPAGTDGSFLQPVPLLESRLVEGHVRLERGGRTETLEWRDDFLMRGDPWRTESRVRAPIVFAGYGISAPALGHDDYAGGDVRGKIVALVTGAPDGFPSEEQAHFASLSLKAEEAARRGAVGVLLLHSPDAERRNPWRHLAAHLEGIATTWLHPDGAPESIPAQLAGRAMLGPTGVEKLFALAGRNVEMVLEGARSGKGRPLDLGVIAALESRSEHRRFTSANVVGRLTGSDPALARTHVVYTAHLDHEGIGRPVNGDSIYNGAYDNASGTAVVLEAARVLAAVSPRPRRSILFLFVTAEEKGLLGSAYFAAHPSVPPGTLVANVNIDMPLFLFPLADVVAYGAETSSLGDVVRAAAAHEGLDVSPDPVPQEHYFIRSDQYSFVRQGIPAAYLAPGFRSGDPSLDGEQLSREFEDRYYHTPADDLSRPMNLEAAERFMRICVEVGWAVARDADPPRWRADSFLARTFAAARAD